MAESVGTSQIGSDSRQSWAQMAEGRHSQPPSEQDLGSETEYEHSRSAPISTAAGIRDPLHFLRDEALNNQREIILELRMLRHCLDRAELRAELRADLTAQDVLYAIVELRRQVSSDGARQRYLLFAAIFAAMLVSSLASSFLILFLNW